MTTESDLLGTLMFGGFALIALFVVYLIFRSLLSAIGGVLLVGILWFVLDTMYPAQTADALEAVQRELEALLGEVEEPPLAPKADRFEGPAAGDLAPEGDVANPPARESSEPLLEL